LIVNLQIQEPIG